MNSYKCGMRALLGDRGPERSHERRRVSAVWREAGVYQFGGTHINVAKRIVDNPPKGAVAHMGDGLPAWPPVGGAGLIGFPHLPLGAWGVMRHRGQQLWDRPRRHPRQGIAGLSISVKVAGHIY